MSADIPNSRPSSPGDTTVVRLDASAGSGTHTKDLDFPGHLTILDKIDQGGIGRIYLAYDETIGRRVAVKELLDEFVSSDPASIEVTNTFIHEAKITGKLEHPGVIPVYELGRRSGGKPYYVMRYVKGQTLERSLKKCVETEAETAFARRLKLLEILIAVCDTVAYAHSKGVIHRDLKPANIISGSFGETIVLDWGLAQVMDDSDNTYFYREVLTHQRHTLSDHTTSGVMGTPSYMAPEQFDGFAGKSSDVYSLGVILYRILTGDLPYHGALGEIKKQIKSANVSPSARQYNPSAPPELIAICEKAMRKQPEERFSDASELANELKAFREGRMVNIYAYSKQELLRRFLNQNKAMVLMVGLLMLTLIGGVGFSIHYARQMARAKIQAEQSLVVLTAFGERSQQQAREIAEAISERTGGLFAAMKQAAAQIGAANPPPAEEVLGHLHNQYPRFESFTLRSAAEISAVFSKDGEDDAQPVLRPIARIDDKRLALVYRVPVTQDGQVVSYLEARLYPDKVLPDFLPLNTSSDSHRRNVWIMRNDGLILFDESPQYIATNLFTDPVNYRSPSLQAFGRLMLIDNDSIGYYSVIDGNHEIYKIAAWDSIDFGPKHSWKVIVSYTYMQRELKPSSSVTGMPAEQ